MMIMRVLVLLTLFIVVDARYRLYHSNEHQVSYPVFDCLYAHLIDDFRDKDESYISNYHLIPYCRRPDDDDDDDEEQENLLTDTLSNNVQNTISFEELRRDGVTGTQMVTWFSSIDVAEQYEKNDGNPHAVFYNCSPPWFGSRCQYKFGYDPPTLFRDIVQATFTNRLHTAINVSTGTCYRFLANCDRGPWPLCLDWREVCDGKVDCIDGEDELFCEKLETNECANGEYRCHYGGQCIPLALVGDSILHVDCLDHSDEMETRSKTLATSPTFRRYCIDVPTFRCEERMARYPRRLPCGDGQSNNGHVLPNTYNRCLNQRDKEFSRVLLTSLNDTLDNKCRQAFFCALYHGRSFGKVEKKVEKSSKTET